MIWFFLALIILAIVLSKLLKNAKTEARAAQVDQNNVRMSNHFNNRNIRDGMTQYSVATLLSMVEKAKEEAKQHGGTFSLEPDVERSLQAKIEEAQEKARRDAQLANAICLAFEAQTSPGNTAPADEMQDTTTFQSSLRTIADTDLQERGKHHLDTLKELAEKAHQQARSVLCTEARNKGNTLPAGETLRTKMDLPLPLDPDDKELYDLMYFVGFQVEGYDLIDPFGPGDLLVWEHRDLLELYVFLIQQACAADGIHVAYEVQIKDGYNGIPQVVTLPYRLTEKPRYQIVASVVLCFTCEM